ncbi:hypothetical protein F2981_21725 (plasmid) [Sinorhizobium meliloti]|nr:hypothetical protein [Sinorhizobium meliloti]
MRLAAALNRQFGGISDCVADFPLRRRTARLRWEATSAFSQLWLLPRLVQFRRDHPNAKIRVKTSDEVINLENGDVDLAIRYGKGPFVDGMIMDRTRTSLYPVCSPDYKVALGDREHNLWQGDYDLISTTSDEKSWYTWQDWFTAVGRAKEGSTPALEFNHFTATTVCRTRGAGDCLGWELLVRTFLEDGTLVRLGDQFLVAEGPVSHSRLEPRQKTLVLDLS